MPMSPALRGRHTADHRAIGAWEGVLAELRHADGLFSTYRADSCVARLNAGEIGIDDCRPS